MTIPTHPVTGEPIRLHNPGSPNPDGTPPRDLAALRRLGLVDGGPDGIERRAIEQPAPFTADAGIKSTGRYVDRPDWHTEDTPQHISALWDRVVELAGQVRRARGRVDVIESDKRLEARQAAGTARKALEAGREPERATPTDWAAETLTREALWRALSAQLRDARQDYDAAVGEGLADWRDSVTASLDELQAKALAQAIATQATVSELVRRRHAAEGLERQRDPQRVVRNTEYRTEEASAVQEGGADLSHVLAYLRCTDPVVTRAWISAPDSDIVPPVHVRRAMAEDWNTAEHLAAIEAEEGYRVTSFTRKDFEGRFPTPQDTGADFGYRAV